MNQAQGSFREPQDLGALCKPEAAGHRAKNKHNHHLNQETDQQPGAGLKWRCWTHGQRVWVEGPQV